MWPVRDSFANVLAARRSSVSYITEPANWAIRHVGESLAHALKETHQLPMHVTASTIWLKQQLVHYGSLPAFLINTRINRHGGSRRLLTIHHLSPDFRQHTQLLEAASGLAAIHTTNQRTKQELAALGLPSERLHVIPLGVDRHLFRPPVNGERTRLRAQLGIPAEAFVIGSFQKDGVGWRRGANPKLIKGPDVLCAALAELASKAPLYVLLTGPARGYVAHELQQRRIPYRSLGYLSTVAQVAPYYHVLDAYLISSRLEGGPQQLLEAWASGVPVVSTAVGMVPDIARHEHDVLLATIGDAQRLAHETARLINQPELRAKLRSEALQTVANFSWPAVAHRYLTELYQPLL